jgi:cytidylate kinase
MTEINGGALPAPVVTIDGTSGCGKGTLAHALAKHLGWHYLDSGALYRIAAWAALHQGILASEPEAVVAMVRALRIRFAFTAEDETAYRVFCNDLDVTEAIRSEACSQMASKVSAIPAVRAALLQQQLDFRALPGLVTDGRDMGTVVFPDAAVKFFLSASLDERAQRRYKQLKEKDNSVSLQRVREELYKRDARDAGRDTAPLVPASDAHVVDTSSMDIDAVFSWALNLVQNQLAT